ncbi:hypothetical protein [Spiroplasma endosymbiont of Labia minor]|uniref:hypothetical protein n=1 Tax=Spiroplasma endosymbiont of Labia minor TaxID=3066305 RepID=UPI0030CBF37B
MLSNLNNKTKKIILGSSIGLWSLILILGVGISIPGMGLDSQKFINSVSDIAVEKIPEGRYTLNKDFVTRSTAAIESTYELDAISALSDEDFNDANQYAMYGNKTKLEAITFAADEWFTSKWDKWFNAENPEHESVKGMDFDINWVTTDMVDFDIYVSGVLYPQRFGFTHAGIQWISQNKEKGIVKDILSPSYKKSFIYNDAKIQSQLFPETDGKNSRESYADTISAEFKAGGFLEPDTYVITSDKGPGGTYIANNKAWFINAQKEVFKHTITSVAKLAFQVWDGVSYNDDESKKYLDNNDANTLTWIDDNYTTVEPADFKIPNYTKDLETFRAGVVFLVVLMPIMLIPTVTICTLLFVPKK